jgi:hypothetical protein
VRRRLAYEHLRSQRDHKTYNNTSHINFPAVVRNTGISISQNTAGVNVPSAFCILPGLR